MPSRNAIKDYAPDSYYHVYARGVNKQKIFVSADDYKYFLSLFERYLSELPKISSSGEPYPHYRDRIVLYAYCLMGNHFHLLVFQKDIDALPQLMRSVMTSYSRYFNAKYKRTGSLFESRYKASRITEQSYLEHITRYIHLNPRRWLTYRYSSLVYYLQRRLAPEWLNTRRMMALFGEPQKYLAFLQDQDSANQHYETMKRSLADS